MSARPSTRRAVAGVVALALVAGGVVAVVLATRPTTKAAVSAPSTFKTVSVTAGTLTTNEQVDGSVVLSNVTQVLHRIEGQTGVSATPAAVTAAPAAPAAPAATTKAATQTATNALNPTRRPGPPTSTTVPAGDCSAVTTTVPTTTTVPAGSVPATPPSGPPGHPGPPGPPPVPTTTAVPTTTVPSGSVPATTTTCPAPPTTTPGTTPGTLPGPSFTTTTITTTTVTPTTVTPTTIGGRPGGGTGSGGGTGIGSGSGSGNGAGGSAARTTQVVTSVLGVGAPVGIGTVLYSVESRPVVALAGALPAWRTLAAGVTDGPDVTQLEMNLVALGYDRDGTMTVDQHFDSHTKAAAERFQAGYALDVTGSITLGSVVFLAAATTVSSVKVGVGDALGDGDAVMSLAAADQQVVITVPAGDESFVVPGLQVTIGDITGTVSLLRSVTQNGATTVQAVITPQSPIAGADNGASVKVRITRDQMAGTLIVPAAALASRIDGSYALQVVQSDGSTAWTTVQVLAVSGADVAVKGAGLTDGTKVLQPL